MHLDTVKVASNSGGIAVIQQQVQQHGGGKSEHLLLTQMSRDRATASKCLSFITKFKSVVPRGQDQEGSENLSGPGHCNLLSHVILENPPETTKQA